ncbi:enoyl-CoA hydratase/isomerase family protein [Microbacterium sp. BG28]|uniref:enoyl-CoA hydratase/isomerase family protein n=1 Tax=Microbacterium sp. BG28 TaxID=3097356 RepID=UPI002A5A17EF|nr:enoyl-CoA hydratase/isomerase family protein [Microbacterium sp. BG28]MDY0829908.1 enoyl-CoA hydratase/isomerase family protein [Microbacterium sp. BG28]
MSGTDATVLVRSDQGVGRLTLNRPRALNAVDIDMVRRLAEALDAWEHDADVEVVLLDGAGDRGFCAGGDVRLLREQAMSSDAERTADFFLAEYALNARLAEYPKPVVAIADGITMGGGVGLASHVGHRVVTERSQLAMPETRIGFTPDVGGTWLLARAPGRIGEYLALTGGTMDAADAIYAGFADHFVPSDRIDAFRDALETRADPQGPAELVLLFDETPDTSRLETARAWIDDAFSADSVGEILARLRAHPEPDAAAAAELIAALSPTALTVTLEAVRRARRKRSLREVLEQEYGLVMWFALTQPDLVEGIRAQLVDKDRSPRWHPASLDELDLGVVDQAFAFRPPRPLWG